MKFFKGLFWALLLNTILIFVFVFGAICGGLFVITDKFAEELDKQFSSQSIATQSLQPLDSSITYLSTNRFLLPFSKAANSNSSNTTLIGNDMGFISCSFVINPNIDNRYSISFYCYGVESGGVRANYGANGVKDDISNPLDGWYGSTLSYSGTALGTLYILYTTYANSNFDPSSISFMRVSYNNSGGMWGAYDCVEISFTCSNGSHLSFCIGTYHSSFIEYYCPSRNIILLNDDNAYYQSGYTAGYNAGDIAGRSTGYDNGYSDGQIVGYNNGYNSGVADGGNYSFLSLIGAVVDAPLSAFTSLLNFNLFGFNIMSLVTGLLTVAVIFAIIRFIMARR